MNESFQKPYNSSMAALAPTVQAGSNPTKMLEGRAHSGAHEANEGDEAQGSPLPLSGFSSVIAVSIEDSSNDPGQAQARSYAWVVNTSDS